MQQVDAVVGVFLLSDCQNFHLAWVDVFRYEFFLKLVFGHFVEPMENKFRGLLVPQLVGEELGFGFPEFRVDLLVDFVIFGEYSDALWGELGLKLFFRDVSCRQNLLNFGETFSIDVERWWFWCCSWLCWLVILAVGNFSLFAGLRNNFHDAVGL